MEVIREFVGDRNQAFDIIMKALLSDIKVETNELLELTDLKEGFTYEKKLANKFGNEGEVEVTIEKIDIPNYYEAHFKRKQGLNVLSYELQDKGDDNFDLIYRESFKSDKASHNLNFSFMSFLFQRSSKKRVKIMLDQLQTLLNQ